MKIRNRQKLSKKVIIIGSILVVLVLAGTSLGVYLYKYHGSLFGWQPSPNSSSAINYQKPTQEQSQAGTQTKQQSLSSSKSSTSGTDQPPTPTPQQSGKSIVELLITAANQTSTTLQIRTQISSSTDSGTCTLTLSKNGSSSITQTASVQALATVTTCKGFDVPLSQLSSGSWHLGIHFENNTLTGDASRDITVQ